MAYQEGYCDGVAGAGMQHQDALCCDDTMHVVRPYQAGKAIEGDMVSDYAKGFLLGSLDRKTMLHCQTETTSAPHRLGTMDGMPVYDPFLVWLSQKNIATFEHLAQWRRETACDRWADGLMNSTAGDVMQEWRNSIEPAAEYMKRATATINRLYGLRADGAGDRNA